MKEHYASGQLQFTDDVKAAVRDAEVVFLVVGTPPKPDGTVDMSYLEAAGKEVCDALAATNSDYMVTIIVKSTVPAGTNRKLYHYLREQTKAYVQVVSNPEFLREGSAVQDFLEPDRIVIGGDSPEAFRIMRRLYDPIIKREENFLTMNWESAELTKYAANTMLAARISFMNEMSILCDHYGADIEDIRKGIGSDYRIGPAFLKAGCGYGGSCFPKDVAAQGDISRAGGYDRQFVDAVQTDNKKQKKRFGDKRMSKLGQPDVREQSPGAHQPRGGLREPVRARDPDGQQEPEEAVRRQDHRQAGPADRRGADRGVGAGVQGRHRRHPREPGAGRDPDAAGQGRPRAGDR